MSKTAIVTGVSGEKLVTVEMAGRSTGMEILRYHIREIPQNGLNGTWLRTVWQQGHFSHNRVVCLIPNSLVSFRSVTLPVIPEAQLEAAAAMELESTNGSGLYLNKIINLQKQGQDYLVRVASVNERQLADYLQPFEAAGFEVLWSGIRARGINNFIKFNSAFLDNAGESVFLDLSTRETEIGVINREALVYLRSIPAGFPEPSDEEAGDFWDELRLSLASYKSATGTDLPQNAWIFGENINQITPKLAAKLDLKVVNRPQTAFTGVITGKDTLELAPFLGIALDQLGWAAPGTQSRFYSVAQSKTRLKREQLMLGGWIVLMALIGVAGIFLGIQARAVKEAKIEKWLTKQTAQLTKLKQTEALTNRDLKQLKLMEKWLDGRGRELEFLLTLQKGLPSDTRITNLTLEDGFIKDLSGITPSVSALLERIKKEPGLAGLSLKGTIAVTENGEIFHLEGSILGRSKGHDR